MAGDEHNDRSMLISLDSLTEDTPNQSVATPRDGESGLIDLGGLIDGNPEGITQAPDFEVAAAVAVARRKNSNLGLIAALLVGVVGLAAAGLFIGLELGRTEQAPPQASAPPSLTVATQPPVAVLPAASSATAVPTPSAHDAGLKAALQDASSPAPVKKPSTKRWRPRTRAERRSAAARAAKLKAARATAQPSAPTKPKTPSTPKPPAKGADEVDNMLDALSGNKPSKPASPGAAAGNDPSQDPLLPSRLSRKQIMSVVRKNTAAVRRCKTQVPGPAGTAMVKMTISGHGQVTSAKLVSGPAKNTPLGACVERTVKVFRFPQFSGAPMSIRMPFSL